MLNQERRKLGLRNDRKLGIGAANVPLPVRILRRIGCWEVGGSSHRW